ncbi:MAG TPA: ABC transporter substrate-binding protein [Pseudonocardia sp.]|nr:ABC transporter substrate-binding protein [Pseudonocardia sp.]
MRRGAGRRFAAMLGCLLAAPAACGAPPPPPVTGPTTTVVNCGVPTAFPAPAHRLFVNDGNMISIALALGAGDQVAAISSLGPDGPLLRRHYGADALDRLRVATPEQPALEIVLAARPDVMVAGWGYSYSEATGLTPDRLRRAGIAPYTLTESCRQHDGTKERGLVDPWTAVRDDVTNLGIITGRTGRASEINSDIDRRRAALRAAPPPAPPVTVFLFDSASDTVFTSGRFGGPEAIITAAGARNATSDVADSWVRVSWERVVQSRPDVFAFVDYPPQSFGQKVAMLRSRGGVKDLPSIVAGRFLNLSYSMWTAGPLNIDAAEQLRAALEQWGLAPPSGIRPRFPEDRLTG